jgi:hypothetical protein
MRTLSGGFSLLGDATQAITSALGLGDFQNGFTLAAQKISEASDEQLRELERAYADPDLRAREFPELVAPIETVSRIAGQAAPQVLSIGLLTEGLGLAGLPLRLQTPTAFGLQKMLTARAEGVRDPGELLNRALIGAGEGVVFHRVNQMSFGPGRIAAQGLVGGGQEVLESGLEDRPLTTANVFKSALTNVALDFLGPGPHLESPREIPGRIREIQSSLSSDKAAEIAARPALVAEKLFASEAPPPEAPPGDTFPGPGPGPGAPVSPSPGSPGGSPLFDAAAFRSFMQQQRRGRFVTSPEPGRPAPSMDAVRFYPGTGGKPGSLYITQERLQQLGPTLTGREGKPQAGFNIPVAQLEYLIPRLSLTPAETTYLKAAADQARSIGSKRVAITTLAPESAKVLPRYVRHESIHSAQPNRPRYTQGTPPPEVAAQFEVLPQVMDAVAERYESEIPDASPLSPIIAKVAASRTYQGYKGQPLGRFLAIEAPAYIGSGDAGRLGLTPREGAILFSDYLESITDKGGFEALSQFAEIARLSPRMQPLLEAVLTNTIAKGRVEAGLPLYGGFGGIFDPGAWSRFLGRKAEQSTVDPTGETALATRRQTLNLPELESNALKRGRTLILTPQSRTAAQAELTGLKAQLATMDPQSPEFSELAGRYTRLSTAIEDSEGVEGIHDYNSLWGHVLKTQMLDQGAAREVWERDLGLGTGDAEGGTGGVAGAGDVGPTGPVGEGVLSSNPFFDPEQWRRLFPFLRRRSDARAESDLRASQLQSEQDALRTPEQQDTSRIINDSTRLDREQLQLSAQVFNEAKKARKEARDRLRSLQILKQNPEFLDPAKQAALDAEISKAQAAYDAAAVPAREEFQRFKGSREAFREAEEERIRIQAQDRLADGDVSYRVDPDTPYLDEIQNLPVSKSFLKVAKDVVDSQGLTLNNDELVVDQVIELGLSGRLPLTQLLPLLEKNGIEPDQFFTDLRAGVRRGATLMAYLSHIRRSQTYLDTLSKLNPGLAAVLQMHGLPSMKDISPYLRERTNLQRLTSIYQGLLTSMFRTAMNNFTMAGARVGMDSFGQLFDSAAQNMGLGKSSGIKNPLSPALALRPMLMMLSEGFSQPTTSARQFVARRRGQDPSRIPDTRATRFFKAIEQVYPRETFPVGEIAVGADITRGDEGLALLRSYRDQALQYPKGGKRREQILSALDKAEKNLKNDQRLVTRTLMRGENLVSVLTWANLAQEKIARRAIFEAKLRRYATEQGIDVDGAISDNTLATKLPVDLVVKAADEALRLTYGTRRLKEGMLGSVGDAALKLGGVPFPNFMVNFLIDQVESSPLGILRYLSQREREKVGGGDLRGLWQPLFGLAIFGMAAQMRAQYYNSLTPTPEAQEDSRAMAATKTLGKPLAVLAPKSGPRWYELQLGSRTMDLRPTPWGAAFFLADYIERQKRGIADPQGFDKGELAKSMLGLNLSAPELASDAIVNTVKALQDDSEFTSQKASTMAGRYIGGQLAGFLTPLKQLSDLAAPFSPGEAIRRETVPEGGGFLPTLGATLQSRIPFASQGLPPYESPTKDAPPTRPVPPIQQLSGISIPEPPTPLEKELSDLGIPPQSFTMTTGIPEVDRALRQKMGELMDTHLSSFLSLNESFRGQPPTRRAIALVDEILPDIRAAAAEYALSRFPDAAARAEILKSLTPREKAEINLRRRIQGLPPLEESLGAPGPGAAGAGKGSGGAEDNK